jgi:hypothetical protein
MPVKIENHFDDFRRMLKTAKTETLAKIGDMVEPTIKDECPKRSGKLSEAGFHEIKDGVLRFINETGYAIFVALGTMYMAANPWPLRAIHKESTRIADTLIEGYRP